MVPFSSLQKEQHNEISSDSELGDVCGKRRLSTAHQQKECSARTHPNSMSNLLRSAGSEAGKRKGLKVEGGRVASLKPWGCNKIRYSLECSMTGMLSHVDVANFRPLCVV